MAKPRLILRDLRHPRLPEGSYELNRSPIRIGRGPRCEIRLHSDRIADVQVILRQEGDRWSLHPVGPAEGCEIGDGYLAESARLDHGTTFRIGHVEMMLSLGHAFAPVEAPEPVTPEAPRFVPPAEPAPPAFAEIEPQMAEEPVSVLAEPVKSLHVPEPAEDEAASVVESVPREPAIAGPVASEAPPAEVAQPSGPSPKAVDPFPEFEPESGFSPVSKRPRSLRIGPLPSSAAATVTKTFGSIVGAEIGAELARPRSSVVSRPAGVAAAIIAESATAAANGLGVPKLAPRRPGSSPARQATPEAAFDSPVMPASGRPGTLRRFLRDHDSSSLFDGRTAAAVVAVPEANPATETAAPVAAESASPAFSIPHEETPVSPWFTGPNTGDFDDHEEPGQPESAMISLAGITVPEVAAEPVVDEPAVGIESTVAEFEHWLQSVGPNLETVEEAEAVEESLDETPSVEAIDTSIEPHDPFEAPVSEAERNDLEPAVPQAWSVPTAIEAADTDTHATVETVDPASPASDEAGAAPQVEPGLATLATEFFERNPEESRLDAAQRLAAETAAEPSGRRTDAHEWPSAQDILRWSADRHGRSFLLTSSEDLRSLKVAPDRTRPREWFRMNFPTALALCAAWLGGAAFLASLGMRMSTQDELTQQSIAAVLAAEKSGAAPRLDQASMQRLTEPASWWEVPPMHRWFRAVFVKLREERGQPLSVASESIAAEVASIDPLYPPARIWKSTMPAEASGEPDLSSLSVDIIPLIMQADAERRRGNHEKACEADRVALKLAAELNKPLKDQEIAYDAEFGSKRFLLPGQKKILSILKRVTKDPEAVRVIETMMPENSPIVWLTTAQLLRHSGLGDSEALARRAAEWPIPGNFSAERRQLHELVKAEASAFLGENDLAIETYDRLVKEIPDSEWKRTVWLNLGILNLQSLKPEAAKMALKKARGEDPYHEIDRHAIATIRGLSDTRPDGVRSAATVRAN